MKLPVGIQQRSSLNHDRHPLLLVCVWELISNIARLIQQSKNPNLTATYTWSICQWWSTNCKFTIAYMKPHQWRSYWTPCVADRPINETFHDLLSSLAHMMTNIKYMGQTQDVHPHLRQNFFHEHSILGSYIST